MIFDKLISYDKKVLISIIVGMIWIYCRTQDCYRFLPRKKILPVLFVGGWIYLNYYEPLFLPIGLSIMIIYKLYF